MAAHPYKRAEDCGPFGEYTGYGPVLPFSKNKEKQWKKYDALHPSTLPEIPEEDREVEVLGDTQFWQLYTTGEAEEMGQTGLDIDMYAEMICAVTYLVHHHISQNTTRKLLRDLPVDSLARKTQSKKLQAKAARWQTSILTEHMHALARRFRVHYDLEDVDIFALTPSQRMSRILAMWNERECINMYRPLSKHIDFGAVFNTPPELENRIRPLRDHLKHTFYWAMNDTLMVRIRKTENNMRKQWHAAREKFEDWRAMSTQPQMPPTLPRHTHRHE